MLPKSSQLLLTSIKIIFFVLFFDLIVNILLPENFKKTIGTTRNYSLKSEKFHHEIAPNIDVYEFFGDKKYKVKTNQWGMRIADNEDFKPKNSKKNIGFIGDSFIYGSGINYNDHFIRLINRDNNNYNYLNLGFVSYSPSIYYKKLKFLIEERGIKFKKIFIFVDHSDVQDEGIFYREDVNGNIVRKWLSDKENKNKQKKYFFKNYLKQNSFIYKFYELIWAMNINYAPIECINNKSKINNFIKYLDYDRFAYGIDQNLQNKKWVKEGQNKILQYLFKIKNLLQKHKVDLKIIYYPSAIELLANKNLKKSAHFNFLKKWTLNENIELIDTAEKFNKNILGSENYKNFYILCDVHWNENGHKIIADTVKNYINE